MTVHFPPLPYAPRVLLVLGSGLGDFAESLDADCVFPYGEIEEHPTSTVGGHSGRYLLAHIEGVPTLVMQGRVHYYEGYGIDQTVLPIHLARSLGVDTVILTNASGGIREDLVPGSLMLLSDHIASFMPSPLRGANDDSLGTRFPDMTEVYDAQLRALAKGVAQKAGIDITEGVYLQVGGPQYETPAEIRAYRTMGADAVGMSTACEAIAARHAGMRVLAVSCITNKASGLGTTPLSHEEVTETSSRTKGKLEVLLRFIFGGIAKECYSDTIH